MTPVELSRTVRRAVRRAVDDGVLAVDVPARVVVARPGAGGSGDYATGVALQLARPAGVPARRVAEVLRERLLDAPGVGGVDITGPGFLNITFSEFSDTGRGTDVGALVGVILREQGSYGHLAASEGGDVCLDVAPGLRAAVVADAAARILRSQGVTVTLVTHGQARPADRTVVPIRPLPVPAAPDPVTLLGPDAARWALLHPAPHHRADLTAETHLTQRESNPFFLVRYAHSRARAFVRNAADLGFSSVPGDLAEPGAVPGTAPGTTRAGATALPALLADHPAVLAVAARHAAPDRLARYLVRVADALLRLAGTYRILPFGDEKPSAAHRARLALAEAAGTVLAGGLDLLGIDAPAIM